MSSDNGTNQDADEQRPIEVDLRNPLFAGLLAWLIPGAGHFYQRRYAKGTLYCVCILGAYFFGLTIGGGHVVYASWKKEDRRWQYFCQVGVGLPALPALIQNKRVMADKPPLFADIFAPPLQPVRPNDSDHLAKWHLEYKWRFDMGTLYTMIAGLLNILAICDAMLGPMLYVAAEPRSRDPAS